MGYIMPVIPFDYQQYQNRMKTTGESPHYISNVYKTVFHPISTAYEEEAAVDDRGKFNKQIGKGVEEQQGFVLTKWQEVNLTGKGGIINEKV